MGSSPQSLRMCRPSLFVVAEPGRPGVAALWRSAVRVTGQVLFKISGNVFVQSIHLVQVISKGPYHPIPKTSHLLTVTTKGVYLVLTSRSNGFIYHFLSGGSTSM